MPAAHNMPLVYCRMAGGNFGDDLNATLWNALFPDLEQLGPEVALHGIGTILSGKSTGRATTAVLGSGASRARIGINAHNSDIRWVRGPRSARAVGLPAEFGIGDPAWLHADLYEPFARREPGNGPVGLMPHHASWKNYDWHSVARAAGMTAIDARSPPACVIEQMRGCSRILTESLHGAIFADAMSLPWAPAILAHRFHRFKWLDWSDSINRRFEPFIPDRALIGEIGAATALRNWIARELGYQASTRCPSLRAVAASLPHDAKRVSAQLFAYGANESHFAHSRIEFVKTRRDRMLEMCAGFARDYGLRINTDVAPAERRSQTEERAKPGLEGVEWDKAVLA